MVVYCCFDLVGEYLVDYGIGKLGVVDFFVLGY